MADGNAVAQALGQQVATLSIENAVLRVENTELRQHVAALEKLTEAPDEE